MKRFIYLLSKTFHAEQFQMNLELKQHQYQTNIFEVRKIRKKRTFNRIC